MRLLVLLIEVENFPQSMYSSEWMIGLGILGILSDPCYFSQSNNQIKVIV